MITLFFSALIRPIFLATVCLSFFLQSDCNHDSSKTNSVNTQNGANVAANNNSNVSNVKNETLVSIIPKGNGHFVLYYGDGGDEGQLEKHFKPIRDTKPAFVIVGFFGKKPTEPVDIKQAKQVICYLRGGSAKECVENPVFAGTPTDIKTLYYVTVDQADSMINSQIESVMNIGYDGIFFDETNRQNEDSQNNRYKKFADSVHLKNTNDNKKIVIVNPGYSGESVCRMFEYADIVSVENHWNKKVPKCNGIEKWQWLAVQGDPSTEKGSYAQPPKDDEGDKAINRLKCFRKNGGFWYFTTGWDGKQCVHWRLPQFLERLADEAKKESTDCKEELDEEYTNCKPQ